MIAKEAHLRRGALGYVDVLGWLYSFGARRFLFSMGLLILSGLTEGISIALLIPLIALISRDTYQVSLSPEGGLPDWFPDTGIVLGLPVLLSIFLVLVIVQVLLMRTASLRTVQLVQSFVLDTRQRLFESVAFAEWSYLSRSRYADLHHLLVAEVERLSVVAMSAINVTRAGVLAAIYCGLSMLISVPLTIVAAGLGVIVFLCLHPIRRRAKQFGVRLTDGQQAQSRIISDFLSGLKVQKAYATEERAVDQLRHSITSVNELIVGFARMRMTITGAVTVGSAFFLSIFTYVGLTMVEASAGALLTLLVIYFRVGTRAITIQNSLQDIDRNVNALERLTGYIDDLKGVREPGAAADARKLTLTDAIRVENVSYRHEGAQGMTVEGASFTVPAKGLTLIIGPTGAGKTTISDLLLGLLAPETGKIRIDSTPLDASTRRRWRRQVGFVPQDPVLSHASVRDNLREAAPDADDDRIEAVLRATGAWEIVVALPEGLDTILGERGQLLSGGERQRVAFAKALIRYPDFILLDEATASLDWEAEATLLHRMAALKERTTMVAITHRPALMDIADHVIVLKGGRIVSAGLISDPAHAAYLHEFTTQGPRPTASGEETAGQVS